MTTRSATEDQIIDLLKSALPESVRIGSLPLGMDDRKAMDVRSAACWVVYAGGPAKQNQAAGSLVQAQTWSWSVLILAKKYRSSHAAATAALELLDKVEDALVGQEIAAGQIVKTRDSILRVPDGSGVIGYEAVFSIQTYLRK
ncbi:Gp37 family protein [Desulfoplanes formicivorans]|uniref:DUF3168 domain-containing protein n=1 Tax=Desulfoplanes formicivorans TaxID=1592317 RepID=A0A194AGD2_9BACT|nr:phage protein Gp37 [Desulfoplanes formicivorans]GAU08141.1 hypothetical protein DPF_0844 [Desulfoplanes formicivorans]